MRVLIPTVVTSPSSGAAVQGATVTIVNHYGGGVVPTYPDAVSASNGNGGSGLSTDQYGHVTRSGNPVWVSTGTYDFNITGAGLTGVILTLEMVSGQTDDLAGNPSLRTLGTGAQQAASGSDSRLSDQRTPLPGSVTAGTIAAGAVTASALGAGSVTAAALGAGAVTASAMSGGSVPPGALQANSVTTASIQAGAVGTGQIASGAVGSGQIAGGAVGSAQLAANAVQYANINPGAVQSASIAGGQIGTGHLQNNGFITWSGGGSNLILIYFANQPTLGNNSVIVGYPAYGFAHACVAVLGVSTAWYSSAGTASPATTAYPGGWIRYYASGGDVVFDSYNPNGAYMYPYSTISAIGY